MEFTVNRTDLLREMGFALPAVGRKNSIPILGDLLLQAEGDQLRITGTDLEMGITCACQAQVVEAGAGTLPAKRLHDYVRLLPAGDVKVKFAENHWATITCGRSRTRIAGRPGADYPEQPPFKSWGKVDLPAVALRRMIQRTQFAITTSETRYQWSGALLLVAPESLTMVATDGHRLAHVVVADVPSAPREERRILLPTAAMTELARLMDAPDEAATVQCSQDEHGGNLYFEVAGRRLMARQMSGSFVDYERVLPKEFPYEILGNKAELRAALERVSQFSDEHTRTVRLAIEPGKLRVFAALADAGDSEEVLDGERMRLLFRDANAAAELREADGDGYRYVVMPMRV